MISSLSIQQDSDFRNFVDELDTFTNEEKDVIYELVDVYFNNKEQKDYIFKISTIEGQISAFICFGPTPMTRNTYDLYWIATHQNFRGKGLAHQLVDEMKDHMRKHGAKKIRIETSSQELYSGTQKFYQQLKFNMEARLRDFYSDGDDLLIFTAFI